MNKLEISECVQFFLELYPSMTPAQGVSLAHGIARYEASTFRSAARMAVLRFGYVNDAIPALIEQLRVEKATGPREMTWVDEANVQNRLARATTVARHKLDDELIAAAPASEVELLVKAVADSMEEPIRSIWKRKGLDSRGVRCAVAERLSHKRATPTEVSHH